MKKRLLNLLYKQNINLQVHYIPLYKFTAYKNYSKLYLNSEYYYKNFFSLPIYHNINENSLKKSLRYHKKDNT